jgi:Toastrack DUF4097
VVLKRLSLAILSLLLASTAMGGKVYRYQYQKIVDVESNLQLSIRNSNGNITLTTNDDYKLKIDAVKNINAESKEEAEMVAEHVQIDVESNEGHFTIAPRFLEMRDRNPSFFKKLIGSSGEPSYGSIDFVISVPTDCSADINNTSGNIEIAGLRGRLNLSVMTGNISVRDGVGGLEITTTTGKVSLKDIEGDIRINATGSDIDFATLTGDLEVRNSSGTVKGEYLKGDLTVTQTTGAIDVARIEGDVRVKSVSGKVTVGQDSGALDIYSESGNISIKTELASKKDYIAETVSGSIEFLVPEASSGRVSVEAQSGDIDTRIPIAIESFSKTRISGAFGSGGPKISLSTRTGEITLAGY